MGNLGSKLPAPVTSENDWPIGVVDMAVVFGGFARSRTIAPAVTGDTFIPLARLKVVAVHVFWHEARTVEARRFGHRFHSSMNGCFGRSRLTTPSHVRARAKIPT